MAPEPHVEVPEVGGASHNYLAHQVVVTQSSCQREALRN